MSRSIGSQSSNLDFSSEKKVEFFGWNLFCLVKSPCGYPFEAFKREKIEPNIVCGCQSKTGSKSTCEDIKCLFVSRLMQIAASEQLAIERKCLIQLFFRLGLGVGGEVAPALSRHHGGGVVGEDEEEEGEGGGRGGATSGEEGED